MRGRARTCSRSAAATVVVVGLLGSACVASPADERGEGLQVVSSMTVIADFAREVGGDHAEVTSLVPRGADPHTHEPTPADARAVADADVVLANGADLEPWFDAIAAVDAAQVVWLTDELADRVVSEEDGRPDPHLWLVPELAIGYVEAIAAALVDAAPAHAADFRDNARAYVAELSALDERLATALEAIPEPRRVLVTPHDAYTYFAEAYGFEVATIVGVSTEEEPSAAAVQRLIDEVRARDVPTVFVEATVPRAVIDHVAADAGVEVGGELYGDSLGEPGSGAETYVDMMEANAEALVDGLAPR